MSIRFKILAIVVSLLALIGAAFALYTTRTTANYRLLRLEGLRGTIEYACEQVNRSVARMERNAIDLANSGRLLYISGARSDAMGEAVVLENFASFPASIGGGLWYEPYRFRANVMRSCFYALRDPERGTVQIDPNFEGEIYDYHNQSWYREIAAAVSRPYMTAWTRPYFDETGSRALMTTVGACMYAAANGQFIGMSTVDWVIEDVVAELSAIRPTGGSFILLAVPGDDYVISNTRASENFGVGASLRALSWYSGIVQPQAGEVSSGSFSLSGTEYLSFAKSMDNGWLFVVAVPRGEIFVELEVRNRNFLRVIAAASAALLVLAWFLVSTLVNKPIRRLIAEVEELGRGNLAVRVTIRSRDEIGLLGTAFNRMTGDLRALIEKNALEHAERERMAGELHAATTIQTGMLPRIFPPFPERSEFDLHAAMLPAREVGGDFYDFFLVDENRLAVVMADVSGKGVPAALFMVIARTLIKNNAQGGKDPSEVFVAVNNLLCENNEADMFVTAFMGYLDIRSGGFSFVNAGHNPPLIRRAGGSFAVLPVTPQLPLAMFEGIPYPIETMTLGPGDSLLLYTDGVTEAMNRERQLFGEARLIESANRVGAAAPRETIQAIKADIDDFTAGEEQYDDITMLALRMAGGGGAGRRMTVSARLEELPRLYEFTQRFLTERGCPAETLGDILLAVEEIFVNIAQYAYPGGRAGEADLSIEIGDGGAILTFADSGIPFDPLAREDPDIHVPLEARGIGGLGVFMVKKLVDAMSYRREGDRNILTLRKKFAPGTGGTA